MDLPLHPMVVHLPLALAFLIPAAAGIALLASWKRRGGRAPWVVALGLQALLLVSGFVALQTGETDEHRVEKVTGEQPVEAHEEAAESFVAASAVVVGAMIVALLLLGRPGGAGVGLAATLGTLLVLGLGVKTGHAGGELVYRHGAAAAFDTADSDVREHSKLNTD